MGPGKHVARNHAETGSSASDRAVPRSTRRCSFRSERCSVHSVSTNEDAPTDRPGIFRLSAAHQRRRGRWQAGREDPALDFVRALSAPKNSRGQGAPGSSRLNLRSTYGRTTGQLGAVAPLASVQTIRPWMAGLTGVLAEMWSARTSSMKSWVVLRDTKFG